MVTRMNLNLLEVSVLHALSSTIQSNPVSVIVNTITNVKTKFYSECIKVSKDFPNLWKLELGCPKDYKLDVKFKYNTEPRFIRPRTVPIAMIDDLNAI